MKFYDLPPAFEQKITDWKTRPYVKIAFQKRNEYGDLESFFIPDSTIIECVINSYKAEEGGTISSGEVLIDNRNNVLSFLDSSDYEYSFTVEIWYCLGNEQTSFLRHVLYVDHNGLQFIETGFNDKKCKIHLIDLSRELSDSRKQKNWTDKEVFVHTVVCDKEHPEKSLVHLLCKRAGLSYSDVDCCHLPFSVPYVEITKNVWEELSELARCYKANLECGKDKPISFTESPYENGKEEEVYSWTLTENEITHFRSFDDNGDYANSIRLKYTHYSEMERQELWHYADSPSWYDENMTVCYPFTDDSRAICNPDYKAFYSAFNKSGKICEVVYADEIDTKDTFEKNLRTNGETFLIEEYDTSKNKNCAEIRLNRNNNLIALYEAKITGKPIIKELNTCIFKKDENAISAKGQLIKNVTNKYLSDDLFEDKSFCEKRVEDELFESVKRKRSFYVTTYLPIIHARVGAWMKLRTAPGTPEKTVLIEQITFRYKKDEAFSSELWLKQFK